MRLIDLDARIAEPGILIFNCPCGRCGGRIRVPMHPNRDRSGRSWTHFGNLEKLTLNPSVDAGCWHGVVENGEIKTDGRPTDRNH